MPKVTFQPLHGWRTFLGEVGIIVLGVLIALGLGEVARTIGLRSDTREARNAISLELGEALGTAIERSRFSPCVDRRLDALAIIVDQAATDGRLPPLGDIRSPPVRAWNHGIWDSIVSAQTAAHFNREELNAYVAAYDYVVNLDETNRQELAAWTMLYAVVGPGRSLTPGEAIALRGAIGEARVASRGMALQSLRLQQRVDAYDLPFNRAAMLEFSERPLSNKEICQPIDGDVPAHYGQSPFRTTLDRARKSPIKRITH